MLKETEDFLKKLRTGGTKLSRKNRFKLWLKKNNKKIKNISIFITILLLLFFPQYIGSLIGNWIVDFVGTIVKIVGSGF